MTQWHFLTKTLFEQKCLLLSLIPIAIKWMGFIKTNHLGLCICFANALPSVNHYYNTKSSSDSFFMNISCPFQTIHLSNKIIPDLMNENLLKLRKIRIISAPAFYLIFYQINCTFTNRHCPSGKIGLRTLDPPL